MTWLFSSKWLACALAILVLVLIRTSSALKCYWCLAGEASKDCRSMVCPDEDFYHTFGFPSTKEVHVACYILKNGDQTARLCTPNGNKWADALGGQGKCLDDKTVNGLDDVKKSELMALAVEERDELETMTARMEEAGAAQELLAKGQISPQQITPELKAQMAALEVFKAQQQQGRSSGKGGKICVCNTDLCNTEEFKGSSAVSGFGFRNGAIIVLAAFTCLLAYGF